MNRANHYNIRALSISITYKNRCFSPSPWFNNRMIERVSVIYLMILLLNQGPGEKHRFLYVIEIDNSSKKLSL